MSTVFLYCAAIGGTLLVLQFVMLLFGAGGDSDLHGGGMHGMHGGGTHDGSTHDGGEIGHDQGSFLKLLSIQTVTTFATFFGLIGLATQNAGWSTAAVAAAATMAGVTALWIVAQLTRSLVKLQSSGNVDLHNAIGATGSVYLRIPGPGEGHGRVLVQVQGRTVECRAISQSIEIPTGATVRVMQCLEQSLLVVEPIS